jgi:hypothetical protein
MRKAIELKNSRSATLTTFVVVWFWRKGCAVSTNVAACCGTSSVSSDRSMSRMRASSKMTDRPASARMRKGTSESRAL